MPGRAVGALGVSGQRSRVASRAWQKLARWRNAPVRGDGGRRDVKNLTRPEFVGVFV